MLKMLQTEMAAQSNVKSFTSVIKISQELVASFPGSPHASAHCSSVQQPTESWAGHGNEAKGHILESVCHAITYCNCTIK